MTYITNKDYLLEVASNRVAGFSGVVVSGVTFSMGVNWMSIWDSTDETIDLGLQASASTVKVASTDANDASAGTGAQTILLVGLDELGVDQIETVSLNGQTEVTTVSLWSSIHVVRVMSVGSTGTNEGTIWVGNGVFTSGVPATKYLLVDVGLNISHTYIYTVPANKQARIVSGNMSSSDLSKGYTIRLCIIEPGKPVFHGNVRGMAGGNNLSLMPRFTPALPAGTILTLQAKAEQGTGGNFAAVTELLLEDVS